MQPEGTETSAVNPPLLRFGTRIVVGQAERACLTAVLVDERGEHVGLTAHHSLDGQSRALVTASGTPIGEAREVATLTAIDLALITLAAPVRWTRELPGHAPIIRLRAPTKAEFRDQVKIWLARDGGAEPVRLLAAAHPGRPSVAAYSLAAMKQAAGDSGAPLLDPRTGSLVGVHLGGAVATISGARRWYPGMQPIKSHTFSPPLFLAPCTEPTP